MHTPDNNPLWTTLRRGLRLLAWPLLAIISAACSTTTRHPTSEATEVILRFTYDDGKPMRHDNYIATARQLLWTRKCTNFVGTRPCGSGVDTLFMSGKQPLDAQGEVRVTIRSSGPIGDYPSQYCINGKAYVFDSGNWTHGPFVAGQVIQINYKISERPTACTFSSSTPAWWR